MKKKNKISVVGESMKRKLYYWAFSVLVWMFSLVLLYSGAICIFLSGEMGPRGNIDYPDFSAAQKRRSVVIQIVTVGFGACLIIGGGGLSWSRKRMIKRILS